MSELSRFQLLFGVIITLGLLGGFAVEGASITDDALTAIPRGGQLVLFGDSITSYGDQPDGWVRILRGKLAGELGRPDMRVINAGQGGNTVQDLHRRFFWRMWRKPDVVVLCIGINDARFAADQGYSELDLRDYREGLTSLVRKIQATGATLMVVSPIVFGERPHGMNEIDKIVDAYARTAKQVAADAGAAFLDLRSVFLDRLASANPAAKPSGVLTYDGLHLSAAGNALVAQCVLDKLAALPAPSAKP